MAVCPEDQADQKAACLSLKAREAQRVGWCITSAPWARVLLTGWEQACIVRGSK